MVVFGILNTQMQEFLTFLHTRVSALILMKHHSTERIQLIN